MRSTAIKLGVFTVFTILITFALAGIIGKLSPFDSTYQVHAYFTDATGILNGDPVKIAGVDVGKVVAFKVSGGEAVVTFEISGDTDLPDNVIAEIKFRNLLGQRIVNLSEPENPSTTPLGDQGEIPVENTRPALDLSVVFNNLRPLIQSTNPEEINLVSRAILEVFEGREGHVAQILGNVGEVTQELADKDQRLARLVSNLNDLTEVLNGQSGNIRGGINRFGELMESLAQTTPTIERVVDQLNDASGRFGGILARNRANLDQELDDLNTVLSIVNDELASVDIVAKNLKELLLATARSQSYGEWWNLYVPNLCPEAAGSTGCAP